MNRREILKSVMAIPFIGVGTTKVVHGKSRATVPENKLFTDGPNWNNIVVNRGWGVYTESIRAELERVIGETATMNRIKVEPNTVAFWCELSIFCINKLEYESSNAHNRREIPRIRWIDFCWGLNDVANMYTDFIQRFDPGYNPRNHKN